MIESRREFLKKTGAATATGLSSALGAPTGSLSKASTTSQQETTGDFEIKDITWEMGSPMPWPTKGQAQAAIGQNIYVFGGIYINYAEHRSGPLGPHVRGCGDAYVFNLETQQWRRLPDVPRPVYGWDAAPYKGRYIIITGGIRDYPVEHPYRYKDHISKVRSPNFDVLVFDTLRETYRALPSQIPAYQAPPERRQQHLESKGFDFSKGVYRLSAELSRVGDRLYLCGGEVVSPHNVTDEIVVGTIQER